MKRFVVLTGVIAIFSSSQVFACAGGREWVDDSGLYTTDITNDTLLIQPGGTVHFDFALVNKNDPKLMAFQNVPYDSARVTLLHGADQLFTRDIPYREDRELAGFDYQFPQKNAGYTLSVHFLKAGADVAVAKADFPVGTGEFDLFSVHNGLVVLLGTLGGAFVILFFATIAKILPIRFRPA